MDQTQNEKADLNERVGEGVAARDIARFKCGQHFNNTPLFFCLNGRRNSSLLSYNGPNQAEE